MTIIAMIVTDRRNTYVMHLVRSQALAALAMQIYARCPGSSNRQQQARFDLSISP